MDAPAIKGSAIQALVEDVRRLVESGRLPRETLEARLGAEDLALLEQKILPALWYPIGAYERLARLLLEVEGGGRCEYLVRRGARAAERLFESGLYQQLRRGEERARQLRNNGEAWSEWDGNLMASLAGAIFSFTRWCFRVDPDDDGFFRIEATEAEQLPEEARHAAQGFIQYVASRLGGAPTRVTSERIGRDVVVFRLRRRAS